MNTKLVPGALVKIVSSNRLNNWGCSTVYIRETPNLLLNGQWVAEGKIWLVLERYHDQLVKIISSCGKHYGWIEEHYYTEDNTEVVV